MRRTRGATRSVGVVRRINHIRRTRRGGSSGRTRPRRRSSGAISKAAAATRVVSSAVAAAEADLVSLSGSAAWAAPTRANGRSRHGAETRATFGWSSTRRRSTRRALPPGNECDFPERAQFKLLGWKFNRGTSFSFLIFPFLRSRGAALCCTCMSSSYFSSGAYPHSANLDVHCVVASRHLACSPTRHAAWVRSSPTTVALGSGRVWIEYASSPSAPSTASSVHKVTGPN